MPTVCVREAVVGQGVDVEALVSDAPPLPQETELGFDRNEIAAVARRLI